MKKYRITFEISETVKAENEFDAVEQAYISLMAMSNDVFFTDAKIKAERSEDDEE